MYFIFDKKRVHEDYPIFSSDINCLIHFCSLDAVKNNYFDAALFSIKPDVYDSLYRAVFDGKLSEGFILPYRKTNPVIIHIPCKYNYYDDFNLDLVKQGLEKLQIVLSTRKEFAEIKKIGIQKETFDADNVIEILNSLDLPEIIFFEKKVEIKE